MTHIPRSLVAEVLGVAPEALPPGDLPLERLASRLLDFLNESLAGETGTDHPEAWTFLLFGELVARDPAQALAVVAAMIAEIETPDEAALIASGPLDELLNTKGPELMAELQAAVAASPRFGYVLGAVVPEGSSGTIFWKTITALTADVPSLDDGADLPEA